MEGITVLQQHLMMFFFLLGVAVGVGLMFLGILLSRDERKNEQRPIYVEGVKTHG